MFTNFHQNNSKNYLGYHKENGKNLFLHQQTQNLGSLISDPNADLEI